jgi:hypothetical protein
VVEPDTAGVGPATRSGMTMSIRWLVAIRL